MQQGTFLVSFQLLNALVYRLKPTTIFTMCKLCKCTVCTVPEITEHDAKLLMPALHNSTCSELQLSYFQKAH